MKRGKEEKKWVLLYLGVHGWWLSRDKAKWVLWSYEQVLWGFIISFLNSCCGCSVAHGLQQVHAQVHACYISDTIQPSHPLTPSSPYVLNFSQHQEIFWWVSCLHQMTKILEFHFLHQSFQRVFELISLMIDWFDLAAQKTLRSLLQHNSLKKSIIQCSVDF